MKLPFLLLFAVLFLSFSLKAQQPRQIIQRSVDLYPLMKNQLMAANPADSTIKIISQLPNALFRITGDTLSTATLNASNPGTTPFAIEQRRITLPDMSGMPDTLVLMAGLENPQGERTVNIMLIGNMRDRLAYFVDDNNNGDFTDDGPCTTFRKSEQIKKVIIRQEGQREPFEYLMYDLVRNEDYLRQKGIVLFKRQSPPVKRYQVPLLGNASRLNLSVNFATGSGEESFAYTGADSANKEYSTVIDAVFQLNTSLSYAYRHLNVGVSLAVEANQVGRSHYSIDGFVNYNIGTWPRTRVIYGLFAEYDFRLYRNLYLTPVYHFFWYQHLQEGNFGGYSAELNRDMSFRQIFRDKTGQRYGGKLKIPISERVLFFAELTYVRNHFRLNEPFIREAHAPGSVDTRYDTFNYGFGVQFLLINRNRQTKLSKTHPQNGVY